MTTAESIIDWLLSAFAWLASLNKWQITLLTVVLLIGWGSLCFLACVFLSGAHLGNDDDSDDDAEGGR